MGWFDPPHVSVIKKLPSDMKAGAREIETKVSSSLIHVKDQTDVSFCIIIGVASWIYELEQAGVDAGVPPATRDYVFEAARIAAKDMRRKECIPYIEVTLRKMKLASMRPG